MMSRDDRSFGEISNYLVFLFLLFSIATGGILFYLVKSHSREMEYRAAALVAKTTAENIDSFRSFYSKRIVLNVLDGDIDVTHRYQGNPSAIPLPATLSIELGDYMREQAANIDYKLFSEYPFPWRNNRGLDVNELDILKERPSREVVFKSSTGSVRYFSPVVMDESCVACHNRHPDSPKTDWRPGDIRGYQVVSLPPNFGANPHGGHLSSFNQIIMFFMLAFILAFIAILYLVKKNKAAFVRLQAYAQSEAKKSIELSDANSRLEKSLSELNAILENAADGIITINDHGVIVSVNRACEEIFGYNQHELIGKNIKILMVEIDSVKHDNYIKNFLSTGIGKIIGIGREVIAVRKDGEIFPVDLSIGHIQYENGGFFTGIIRDISERKTAEKDLIESQKKERLLSLVASLTDNAVIITNKIGLILWVNKGFEALSGYESHEVFGRKPGDILQGTKSDHAQKEIMSDAIIKNKSFQAELINYTKHGAEYWVQINAQPIINADGSVDGYIAIERNVTEEKKRSSEIIQAREAAEESNRSKSRFLAMMSHEIRTPLNAIIGTVSLLNEGHDETRREKFLSTAKKAAENLQSIINDILDISKLESEGLNFESTTANPVDAIRDVIEVMEPRAMEKGINLEWSHSTNMPALINTDFARLRQILINIISNAIKFTDAGQIKIKAESNINIEPAGIRIEVSDTGIGISKEDLPHIFDEFWTKNLSVKNTAPGTGLGLAISKRLTESLGGMIGVSSCYGEGTTFWIEIPVGIVDESTQLNRKLVSVDLARQFKAHVLIAEDNSANQLVASAMLEKLGVTSDIVANGIEAIAALERRSYDIILMDLNMPEMDGIEATKIIRDRDLAGDTPIIAMTANVMEGVEDKLRAEGFNDYLAKPFVGIDLRLLLTRAFSIVDES